MRNMSREEQPSEGGTNRQADEGVRSSHVGSRSRSGILEEEQTKPIAQTWRLASQPCVHACVSQPCWAMCWAAANSFAQHKTGERYTREDEIQGPYEAWALGRRPRWPWVRAGPVVPGWNVGSISVIVLPETQHSTETDGTTKSLLSQYVSLIHPRWRSSPLSSSTIICTTHVTLGTKKRFSWTSQVHDATHF
jgi:hypothetical protein